MVLIDYINFLNCANEMFLLMNVVTGNDEHIVANG